MPPRSAPAAAAAIVAAFVLLVSSCPSRADAGTSVGYQPPIDAPVVDAFRPPSTPYGPGNRGLEYATDTGQAVAAAADGVVAFAGSVAGARHVTILHDDGLRTSYSFLATIEVSRGQRVQSGDTVGTSTARFHFGVRDPDDNYLDPESLFSDSARAQARLVPGVEEGAPPLASSERSVLLRLVLDHGLRILRDGVNANRWAMHYAVELRPEVRLLRATTTLARLRAQQQTCTPAAESVPPAAERRIAVLVGGFGSTSSNAAIDDVDTATLGIAEPDVLRFSYAGGRVPDERDGRSFESVLARPYGVAESTDDLEVGAQRFDELIQAVAAAEPDVPIDVIAHSQGGVVARLAIARAAAERRLPAEVSTLVTIGTPHNGADLATGAVALGQSPSRVIETLVERFAGYDPRSTAVAQLSETSEVVDRLDEFALPPTVRRVSIAARGDLVVPVPRTLEDDLPSSVVPVTGLDAHDRLPGIPATTREIALAIAGRPPTCVTETAAFADAVWGEAVAYATDVVAAAGLAQALGSRVGP